ncbi:MAG: hypothetical protein N4A71_27680 [Carboxylicivirga sp.]|jgi:hypothetical protein|nr:hypothetical protein [Carboxylicivirga sp.]
MNYTNIPLLVKLRLLLSNKFAYIGLFIIAVSSIILSGFIPNTDYSAYKYVESKTSIVKGTIIGITETNTTVNENKIYKYAFEYIIANVTLNGYSFSKPINLEIGDEASIEYVTNEPEISRIINTTNGSFSIETLYFLGSVFLFGLLIIVIAILKRIKLIKYLATGFDIVNSKLVDKMKIPFVRINNYQSLYRLTFEYSVNGQIKEITKYNTSSHKFIKYRTYPVIVNHANHNDAFLLIDLPQKVSDLILSKSTVANNG